LLVSLLSVWVAFLLLFESLLLLVSLLSVWVAFLLLFESLLLLVSLLSVWVALFPNHSDLVYTGVRRHKVRVPKTTM